MLDLIFAITNIRVVVHSDVLERLKSFQQIQPNDPEACGVLLGLQYEEALEITDFTEPQKTDQRTRASFQRERSGHVEQAVSRWKQSNGLIGYLGEWHTHPEKCPTPSMKDMREIEVIAKRNQSPVLVMILGIEFGCCTIIQPKFKERLLRFKM